MKLILMGDVNLMDVTNPEEPFRKILGELHAADVVFGNLECCLHLPASRHSDANEGFFADPVYGGNRDMVGWKMIGYPGARYNYLDWVERHNERFPLPPVSLIGRADWSPKP